ncbi:alpha/beta-hydrolase [Amylocystis lapponica]|nr:alpha/beta-hydrolase [Amylocystis lapponica]
MAKLTPQDISRTDTISHLKLSADASHVVYSVGPTYRTGKHRTSALWIAETEVAGSAQKITSGRANDHDPVFHPTSSEVYFLSDRAKEGGPTKIYRIVEPLCADAASTEPSVVPAADDTQTISYFSISPDGAHLAYISQPHTDKGAPEGITVYREKKNLGTLHVLDLRAPATTARTLVANGAHVEMCSWSPDSTALVFRTTTHPDLEAHYRPVTEAVVDLASCTVRSAFVHHRMPAGPTVWRARGDLVYVQTLAADRLFSALGVWARDADAGDAAHVGAGVADDAVEVADLQGASEYAVEVAAGLRTRIDVCDAEHAPRTLYETTDDAIAPGAWDVRCAAGRYVLVAVRSSGAAGLPMEVWAGVGGVADGAPLALVRRLSAHNVSVDGSKAPVSRPFCWAGKDGQRLEGVVSYPRGAEPQRLPTVIVPHGGPYGRDTLNLQYAFSGWRQYLASHGYLTMSPNYRGSRGYGDAFAQAANGAMGTLEWDDIESMADTAVAQGLADPRRLGLAGYSQGGFLTSWGCTRPDGRFRMGVCGAGVAEWGMLAATSDVPDIEAGLGGAGPWTAGAPVYLRGSPLKDVGRVRVPMLFLHGKEDRRVPLSQAVAMVRGIEREALPPVPPQLVIYPREGHEFQERAHVEDVLRRVLEFVDAHLNR